MNSCSYTWTHVPTQSHTWACVHTQSHTWTCAYTITHVHTHDTCIHYHIYEHICNHTQSQTWRHIHTYEQMCICSNIYAIIFMNISVPTQSHTREHMHYNHTQEYICRHNHTNTTTHMNTCSQTWTCVYMQSYTQSHTLIHAHIHDTRAFIITHVNTCMYNHTREHMFTCMTSVHAQSHTWTHVHIKSHIHNHIREHKCAHMITHMKIHAPTIIYMNTCTITHHMQKHTKKDLFKVPCQTQCHVHPLTLQCWAEEKRSVKEHLPHIHEAWLLSPEPEETKQQNTHRE